jgi:uncharacterized DUF497 family protein
MEISYDQTKNNQNIQERKLSFDRVVDFDFESANFTIDNRENYGEIRRCAIGLLDGRLHVLVFTETDKGIRVISFRKANKREMGIYEQKS